MTLKNSHSSEKFFFISYLVRAILFHIKKEKKNFKAGIFFFANQRKVKKRKERKEL